MKRIHLIISGDVQGVGFRVWARREARSLGLTGWVKNREDGSVELLAEGERSALEELITRASHGPEVAWVKNVNIAWEDASGEFMSFNVLS